ncbi:hypothetical protein [Limosilactobacillus vaginalis]
MSERHGRAMLDLDEKQQREMLMRVVNERLTVRQTEDEAAGFLVDHYRQSLLSNELKETARIS